MKRTPQSSGPWTRLETWDFNARVAAHSVRRLARWAVEPKTFGSPKMGSPDDFQYTLATVHLGRRASTFGAEMAAGRWHNLRLAAASLDGVLITPARPFSFWRAMGRITAERGYAEGAHFEGGCIVPSIGGGLCSVTDALFKLALLSDCEILERHGHTLMVELPGAEQRVDATVKWPYVDLRFAPRSGSICIRCVVGADGLEVAFVSEQPQTTQVDIHTTEGVRSRDADGERYINEIQRHRRPLQGRSAQSGAAGRRAGPAKIIDAGAQPGQPAWVETIGRNRKRVIGLPLRNCNTCEEHTCVKNAGREGRV